MDARSWADRWFQRKAWSPFPFQIQTWEAYWRGCNGLLNAPTGSGKTLAMFMPVLTECLAQPEHKAFKGLKLLWLTPLRSLSRDIAHACQSVCQDLDAPWEIGLRTGDTPQKEKDRQRRRMPEMLITTPESLHLLLAQKNYPQRLGDIRAVVVDEWHELIGSKRGVQVELALSRLKALQPQLRIWGISATVGNLEEAAEVLLGQSYHHEAFEMVRFEQRKRLHVQTIIPQQIEHFPWSGHIGANILPQVAPILEQGRSTLVFTNTRSQAEIWYHRLLEYAPHFAGRMAMHHGSISQEIRHWVEEALHEGQLKIVICTSSLDLGVDFRPVDQVVQIGSPKGVARFLQRAGRSGHRPGAESRIFFVPTHAIELVEGAAIRTEALEGHLEERPPVILAYDVLAQYLVTLAVAEGFQPAQILQEVRSTFAYAHLSDDAWRWALDFITHGGQSLAGYDDFHRVDRDPQTGAYKVRDRRVAMRHRMAIGTIVADISMKVLFMKGGYIGTIEESFISRLRVGDVFWFAGKALALVKVEGLTVYVKKSKARKGIVPSWLGSRMPLSAQMSFILRTKIHQAAQGSCPDEEIQALEPLLDIQGNWSAVPCSDQLLLEYVSSREGHHLYFYPFEGRNVHEGLAALLAWRIGQRMPISFSLAMNDYGFELLSDQEFPIESLLEEDLFYEGHLQQEIYESLNSTEMAKRRFREIAHIAGLVFPGYPNKQKSTRHLQATTGLVFEVFHDYEPDHPLLLQAHEEVLQYQLEENRLRQALRRMRSQEIILKRPGRFTPFAFPIMVDRLRESISSEKLADRIQRMQDQLEAAALKS